MAQCAASLLINPFDFSVFQVSVLHHDVFLICAQLLLAFVSTIMSNYIFLCSVQNSHIQLPAGHLYKETYRFL
jgi:hypothetical protein